MGGPTAWRYVAAVPGHPSLRRSAEDSRTGRRRSSRTGARSERWFLFSMEDCEMKNYEILAMSLGLALCAAAQVKTEVPPVIPGAKPVAVEHIKVHGAALEGNLENDAVEREVIVVLPPSYAADKSRRYPVVYALHGYSIGAVQWS